MLVSSKSRLPLQVKINPGWFGPTRETRDDRLRGFCRNHDHHHVCPDANRAIACLLMAWNAEGESPERALVKNLLLLPATVYPVVLLIVTASSQPVWKKYGEDVLRYMAKGSPSGVFFPAVRYL